MIRTIWEKKVLTKSKGQWILSRDKSTWIRKGINLELDYDDNCQHDSERKKKQSS